MSRPKPKRQHTRREPADRGWLARAETSDPIAGVPGPGRWLILEYEPVALFSLKASFATSSVGKTLVVPTPYAIKMALVDAAFRAGFTDDACASLVRALAEADVHVGPPRAAVVTHTFVKVRQEPKDRAKSPEPYIPSIAYREVVAHLGRWRWAIDLASVDDVVAARVVDLGRHVCYIGKRGSFVQFVQARRRAALDAGFTQAVDAASPMTLPGKLHFSHLDDFGPDADLETLSTFTEVTPKREKHRTFVRTLVPLGVVNTGPGFTHYEREGAKAEDE